jgi:transcriptional regulator with XRE-family HTH domain
MSVEPNGVVQRREQLGMTQTDAARAANVSLATYRRFETGTGVSNTTVEAIARALRVSPATLGYLGDVEEVDLDSIATVTHRTASEDWIAVLNAAHQGDPLTPKQAVLVSIAADYYGDAGDVTWSMMRRGEQRITDTVPFAELPRWVLILINEAWQAAFIDTFRDLAATIDRGEQPYPRCIADEVGLWLCLQRAQKLALDEQFDDETVAQFTDHGAAEDDWDVAEEDLFQDRDFEAIWMGGELLEVTTGELHPYRWFDLFQGYPSRGNGGVAST